MESCKENKESGTCPAPVKVAMYFVFAVLAGIHWQGCFNKQKSQIVKPDPNSIRGQNLDAITKELTAEAQFQEQVLDAKEQTPLIKWQKERVANIRREQIKQVIENLANFDDNSFATTARGDRGFTPGDPDCEAFRVVHLSRVARLVAEGKKQPEPVVSLLNEALAKALEDWPDVMKAQADKWLKSDGSFTQDEPGEFDKLTTKAVVATYILAELQDYESLPILLQSYQKTEKWIAALKPYPVFQFPVPPNITLYAMHRLVYNYPEDKLTPDAINARDEYIKWSDQNLPEPKIVSRSAWNAEYDTSDPMVKITDPKGILHKAQPKINLLLYPNRFKDGPFFQGYIEDKVDEKTQEWFDAMGPFLKTVCDTKEGT